LRDDYKRNIEILNQSGIPFPQKNNNVGFNAIVCNFALHYFVGDEMHIRNIAKFITTLLAKQGRFIFTTFDGRRVFDLLEEHNGRYDIKENNDDTKDSGAVKMSIVRKYKKGKFTGVDQLIEVLLPMSNDYMEEYLVDLDQIEKVFRKHKLLKEMQMNFREFLGDNSMGLTDADIEVISLYQVSTYVLS